MNNEIRKIPRSQKEKCVLMVGKIKAKNGPGKNIGAVVERETFPAFMTEADIFLDHNIDPAYCCLEHAELSV